MREYWDKRLKQYHLQILSEDNQKNRLRYDVMIVRNKKNKKRYLNQE